MMLLDVFLVVFLFNLGYSQTQEPLCGGEVELDSFQTAKTTLNQYEPGITCSWMYKSKDPKRSIIYQVSDIKIGNDDNITVYDGASNTSEVLMKPTTGYGTNQDLGIAKSGVLLVVFESGNVVDPSEIGFVVKVMPVPGPQEALSADRPCGTTIVASNVDTYLSSPRFPENYTPLTDCNYTIQAATPSSTLKINLYIVDLEEKVAGLCQDFLNITTGKDVVDTRCDYNTWFESKSVAVNSSDAMISFTTNDVANRRGFLLSVRAEESGGPTIQPQTWGITKSQRLLQPTMTPPSLELLQTTPPPSQPPKGSFADAWVVQQSSTPQWSDWSSCSVTCGFGTQSRTRDCPLMMTCDGPNEETRACYLGECPTENIPTCNSFFDSYTIANPYDCQSYYECSFGNLNVWKCAPGEFYDSMTSLCKPAGDVLCAADPCMNMSVSSYGEDTVTGQSQNFYLCAMGRSYPALCLPGTVYSSDLSCCVCEITPYTIGLCDQSKCFLESAGITDTSTTDQSSTGISTTDQTTGQTTDPASGQNAGQTSQTTPDSSSFNPFSLFFWDIFGFY